MSRDTHSDRDGQEGHRPSTAHGTDGQTTDGERRGSLAKPLHLEHALALGGVGTWRADLRERVFTFNAAEARLLGLSKDAEELTFEDFIDRIHPEDRSRVLAAYEEARRHTSDLQIEFRLVRPDGTTAWVAAHGGIFRDESGKATELTGIHVDISEQKRVEEELRRLEQWRLLSVEAAEVGDWEYDVVEQRAYWSPKALEQMGLDEPTEEFVDGLEPIHPEDRDRVLRAIERALDPDVDDDAYQVEFRLVHDDDTVVWVESRGHALFEEGERGRRPLRLLGAMVDVTERKCAEKRLRQNRRRLATLLSNLPGMAYRTLNEPHWPMTFVSRGCEELCGYSAEQIESGAVAWDDLIHPDDRQWLWETVQEAIGRHEPFEVEYRIEHADGRLRWMWEQGCAVFEEATADSPLALEGFITDITARKEAERELRAADRRKNQFLAMLGHELRNPLMAIRTAAELLEEVDQDYPLIERARRIITRQSHQMSRLIDELLDISRITRGKLELHRSPVDITQIIEDLLEDRREQLADRQVDCQVDRDLDSPILEADPVRLSQIFDNLLSNAIKFTDRGDRIDIELSQVDGRVEVTVRDTGIGIDDELMPHIFEPFEQALEGEDDADGGLGLGLSLARELVELHGGDIEAYSDGPGTGAEFRVRLPSTGASLDDRDQPSAQPAASRQVLLIEDHGDIAEILSLQLERGGFHVETAASAEEGLDALTEDDFDVVVCDLGLPGMSGFEVAERVRGDEALRGPALVALTGYGDQNTRERSLEAGFDAHLVKPIDVDELADVLEEVCG